MRFGRWWAGPAGVVLACLTCGAVLAQQGGAVPQNVLPAPAPSPLGEAAVPPPPNASALPSVPLAPAQDTSALASNSAEPLPPAESSGWLSGLGFDAEYWYIKPHSQSLDYAIANSGSATGPDGSIVYRNWDYRNAFRAGMSYRLPGQPWAVGFYYTYLHDTASASTVAPDGGFLFATLTHPGVVSQVQTAAAATSLNYNVFDLEVGRWFGCNSGLAIRPFAGGRFARIDQNLSASYNGGDANQDVVSQRLHFNGGGFRVGADAFLNLFWGFSLFGRASGSLLGGDFNSYLVETNNAGATTLTNFTDHFEKVVPVAEMTLGLGWQYHNLRLSAGYMFINYFGLVNVPTFVDDVHQGKFTRSTSDLGLEGVVGRLEWCF